MKMGVCKLAPSNIIALSHALILMMVNVSAHHPMDPARMLTRRVSFILVLFPLAINCATREIRWTDSLGQAIMIL